MNKISQNRIYHEGWTNEEWKETIEILNKIFDELLDKKDKK